MVGILNRIDTIVLEVYIYFKNVTLWKMIVEENVHNKSLFMFVYKTVVSEHSLRCNAHYVHQRFQ